MKLNCESKVYSCQVKNTKIKIIAKIIHKKKIIKKKI